MIQHPDVHQRERVLELAREAPVRVGGLGHAGGVVVKFSAAAKCQRAISRAACSWACLAGPKPFCSRSSFWSAARSALREPQRFSICRARALLPFTPTLKEDGQEFRFRECLGALGQQFLPGLFVLRPIPYRHGGFSLAWNPVEPGQYAGRRSRLALLCSGFVQKSAKRKKPCKYPVKPVDAPVAVRIMRRSFALDGSLRKPKNASKPVDRPDLPCIMVGLPGKNPGPLFNSTIK